MKHALFVATIESAVSGGGAEAIVRGLSVAYVGAAVEVLMPPEFFSGVRELGVNGFPDDFPWELSTYTLFPCGFAVWP